MSVSIYVKGDPFFNRMYTKGVPFLSKNGPQRSLHKKCKLHIKLCTLKTQIKNASANKKRTFLQIKKDVAANKKSLLQIKKQLLYLIYTLVPSLTLFKPRVKTLDGGCHLFSLWEGSQQRINVLLSLWLFPTTVEYSSRVYHLEYQSSTI